jgi:hypothetical protein
MKDNELTLEDIADRIDCLAKSVTMLLQLHAKDREDKKKSKTYIERGHRA